MTPSRQRRSIDNVDTWVPSQRPRFFSNKFLAPGWLAGSNKGQLFKLEAERSMWEIASWMREKRERGMICSDTKNFFCCSESFKNIFQKRFFFFKVEQSGVCDVLLIVVVVAAQSFCSWESGFGSQAPNSLFIYFRFGRVPFWDGADTPRSEWEWTCFVQLSQWWRIKKAAQTGFKMQTLLLNISWFYAKSHSGAL